MRPTACRTFSGSSREFAATCHCWTRLTFRLVDEIENKIVSETGSDPTSSAILGPFWSPNAPFRDNGASIIQDPNKDGRVTLMHGTISDLITGKPIPGAVFDIWQASANGKYDFQDPDNQSPNNLRGKFRADENGKYWFYCYHPTAYSLPTDGPSYKLLQTMDRHPMRPAHIHIMVRTTHIYWGKTKLTVPGNAPRLPRLHDAIIPERRPLAGDRYRLRRQGRSRRRLQAAGGRRESDAGPGVQRCPGTQGLQGQAIGKLRMEELYEIGWAWMHVHS